MSNPTKLLFLLFFFSQGCTNTEEALSKATGFELIGRFESMADSVTILMQNRDTREVDSTYTLNGEFRFKGRVEHPTPFNIVEVNYKEKKHRTLGTFFIENSALIIDKESGEIRLTGSKSNDDKDAYHKSRYRVWNKYKTVLEKKELDHPDSLQLEKYIQEIKANKVDFYTKNPDSYFTGYQMMHESLNSSKNHEKLSKSQLGEIYSELSEAIRNSTYGKAISRYISMPEAPRIGERFIDFVLSSVDGKEVSLSDFEGKYVLVDFWASWCHPCRLQNPHLRQLYRNYQSHNFEILGVSIDENRDKWLEAIEKDSLEWTNGWSQGGRFSEVSQLYRINAIPDNLLINPEGVIINRKLRGERLDEVLESLFERDDESGV